jgi:adenosylhomocysteine nucleosidase
MRNPNAIKLGIISALQEEQQGLVEELQHRETHEIAQRHFTEGTLNGVGVVCALSRIGKVAATMTAMLMIERFQVTHLLFTGVAGSVHPQVHVGDLVVAETLVQHDMDASPLFPKFELPLIGLTHLPSDPWLSQLCTHAAHTFLSDKLAKVVSAEDRHKFKMDQPRVHRGVIASGDQFIHEKARAIALQDALPGLLAVEMEGAAVAQVCYELDVPCCVIRSISDNANEAAPVDFLGYVHAIAANTAFHVIKDCCALIANTPMGGSVHVTV